MNKKQLKYLIDRIEKMCNPVSVFLYGSRARTDFLNKSDFEIGVLMPKKNYVGRSVISKAIHQKGVSIYPFKYEDFVRHRIDTPFQKSIYLRELISSGKTLRGRKVVESAKLPPIRIVDLIQENRFNLGFAFAAMHSYRNGDYKTAIYEFYKSCLYGTRNLEILKLRRFPIGYNEIYKFARGLNLGEYKSLVSSAYKLRQGQVEFSENYIFQNISYLNEFVEPKIADFYKRSGNKILIR